MTKKKPTIIDIPEKMEKFYGKGKMLHPDQLSIEDAILQIPKGSLTTINVLAQKLALDYSVNITCPMRTGNLIKKIANQQMNSDQDSKIPFWRVIRKDKRLLKTVHYAINIAKLEDEGFIIEYTKKDEAKVNITSDLIYLFKPVL